MLLPGEETVMRSEQFRMALMAKISPNTVYKYARLGGRMKREIHRGVGKKSINKFICKVYPLRESLLLKPSAVLFVQLVVSVRSLWSVKKLILECRNKVLTFNPETLC